MTKKVKTSLLSAGELTPQEARVLLHICDGYLRQEIAEKINRSYSTVSKHIESIAEKFGAKSAAQIVSTAVAKGMVNIVLKTVVLLVLTISNSHIDMRRPPQARRVVSVRYFVDQQIGGV